MIDSSYLPLFKILILTNMFNEYLNTKYTGSVIDLFVLIAWKEEISNSEKRYASTRNDFPSVFRHSCER